MRSRTSFLRLAILSLCLFAAVLAGAARAGSPVLTKIVPTGGRRGVTLEVSFFGQRLHDANGVILLTPGLTVLSVEPRKGGRRVVVKLKIDDDCRLGEHLLFLRTKSGISNMRSFQVGVLQEIEEVEPNQVRGQAQAIPLEVTVNGTCQREDRDCYAFEVVKPGRVNFEVQGCRLGIAPFDPYLELIDAGGRVLAYSDDTPFGRMDPVFGHQFEKPGTYYLRLRHAENEGDGNCHYRLHVGTFPRPTGAFPAGAVPGKDQVLDYLGDTAFGKRTVSVPATAGRRWDHFPRDEHGVAPTPIKMMTRVGTPILESTNGKKPALGKIPASFHGVISKSSERDRFRFEAKKGRQITVQVWARRLRSPLDPVISVVGPNGKSLGSNDDTGGPDCRVNIRTQEDGIHEVRIRDQLRRGGPEYFYRVEVVQRGYGVYQTAAIPLIQTEPTVPVPRGGRMGFILRGSNIDVKRQIQPLLDELPAGVTVKTAPYQTGTNQTPVILEAASDAALAGALVQIGAWSGKEKKKIPAGYGQSIPLLRVDNRQPYYNAAYNRLPVAVTDPHPFRIEVEAPTVPLIEGSPLGLKVKVLRDKGFKSTVYIRMLWNPPGVGSGQVTVPGDKSEAIFYVNAGGRIRDSSWKVAIVGFGNANGNVVSCSDLVDLQLQKPYVRASLGRCRAERGGEAELKIDLARERDFKGEYKVEILNLPRDMKAEIPVVNQDSKSVTCRLTYGPKTPYGRHRNIRLRLRVPAKEGLVEHRFQGGEIRVDRPLKRAGPAPKPGAKKKVTRGTVAKPKT